MPGSDRLEETGATEAPSEDAVAPEAAEAVEAPATEAPPARRPRARRARAAEAPAEDAVASEAAEAPATEAPPARTPRARRPRAAEAPAGDAAASEAAAAAAEAPTAEAPAARTPRARRPRAAEAPAGDAAASEASAAVEAPPEEPPVKAVRVPRLLDQYRSRVKGALQEEFGYRNVMQIPKIEKVVINVGLGESKTNPRAMENTTRDLSLITGQKPIITRARRSIAGFKLREGDPIGTAVTLRGNRMYEFMDRLLNAALPRIRDFRGVSRRAFDGRGNYSLGVREQVIFPEIDYGQIDRVRSLQVSIITTASTDREAMRLLDLLGMPFTRDAAGVGGDGNA
jgi:large subunit ribosomal protein L5